MAAACLLALLAWGCAHDKYPYGVIGRISLNVAPPPGWLADPKAPLAPAEKEVLVRNGMPDFVRFWWNSDGRPVTRSDFAGRQDQFTELIKATKKSWVYLGEGKGQEIVFYKGGASYTSRPLTDSLRLLCLYGDPSNTVTPVIVDGERRENWIWIDRGLQIELVDGHIKSTKNFQGTGAGTILK